jgi:hypothetical protein
MERSRDERSPGPDNETASQELTADTGAATRFVAGSVPPIATATPARAMPTASERAFGSTTAPEPQPWQRRLWQLANNHPVAQKLLDNYMDGTGAAVTLTSSEMQACNPVVNIRRSKPFMALVDSLRERGGGTSEVDVRGLGGARSNGTLGNFTITWRGSVTVRADGTWSFGGTAFFYDYWDFDPKSFAEADRPMLAELKVRVASLLLPGKPFHIFSEQVAVSQSSADHAAAWGNGAAPGEHLDNPTFMLDSTLAGETVAGATAGATAPALATGAAIGAAVSGAFVDVALTNRSDKP